MSLRVQLLVVGLLTLALPWAGYRYVQELEGALRDGLEQSLIASANTMASALELQPLSESGATPVADLETATYAHPLAEAPALDGERDDWISRGAAPRTIGTAAEFLAGTFQRTAYLFFSVTDDDRVYQPAPTETPYGDRILLLPGETGDGWLLIHRSGPGVVRSQRTRAPLFAPTGSFDDRVTGYWRETAEGYDIELRLPLDLVGGRLGVALVDVDRAPSAQGGYAVELIRSWAPPAPPGEFVSRPDALAAIGRPFVQPDQRMRIIDAAGWVVFDGGEIDPLANAFAPSSLSLSERFYRLILSRGDTPYQELESPPGYVSNVTLRRALDGVAVAAWYTRGPDASAVIAAAAPIRSGDVIRGAVVLERGSDSILTLTNGALVRLMTFTLLASLVVAFGLLAYATRLSLRVRRLARAADTALSPEGEIRPSLPGSRARDELGDLSRSFSDLLNRLRDYTDYLTTLRAKLAHELRTPLAVVSTSLENLEREPHERHLAPYLARLREGTDRLDSILGAMSEATLIEQAVHDTEAEVFGLTAVVSSCAAAYSDVYPDREFAFTVAGAEDNVLGSADLIAQMLDKLVDNAVSFSPAGSTIRIDVSNRDGEIELGVTNEGPLLPASMRNQLFDSLVSVRTENTGRRHLGLGLYIVSLIVEFHRGHVTAEDLPDGSGVRFSVRLPVAR